MGDLKAEIDSLLEELVERWNAMELLKIRELWDPNETQPYYIPEEAEQPLTGWEAIESYWQGTMDSISRLKMRVWDLQAKNLSADLAVAIYRLHWTADVEGFPKPVGGDNRVTAIFRHTDAGWRFCHYVEAPLAPITYMRQLYELNIDESFKDH